jgi:hypothetical protein
MYGDNLSFKLLKKNQLNDGLNNFNQHMVLNLLGTIINIIGLQLYHALSTRLEILNSNRKLLLWISRFQTNSKGGNRK